MQQDIAVLESWLYLEGDCTLDYGRNGRIELRLRDTPESNERVHRILVRWLQIAGDEIDLTNERHTNLLIELTVSDNSKVRKLAQEILRPVTLAETDILAPNQLEYIRKHTTKTYRKALRHMPTQKLLAECYAPGNYFRAIAADRLERRLQRHSLIEVLKAFDEQGEELHFLPDNCNRALGRKLTSEANSALLSEIPRQVWLQVMEAGGFDHCTAAVRDQSHLRWVLAHSTDPQAAEVAKAIQDEKLREQATAAIAK